MDFVQEAIKWLKFYGYTDISANDRDVLEFIRDKAVNYILAKTNQSKVPTGLYEVAVEMMAGMFLERKKATGALEGFDLGAVESSIKIGDTTVSYGDGAASDEDRLNTLISALKNPGDAVWVRYRRLAW